MKRYVFFVLTIITFLLSSCSPTKQGDLLEIPVDLDKKKISFPFTELVENITTIDLELTDESLINPDIIAGVLLSDNYVILLSRSVYSTKIFLFGIDGKFIRTIGSQGQGPGEYTSVGHIAINEKKNILYVHTYTKIISYDLNEKNHFKEITLNKDNNFLISSINYINDELLIIGVKDRYNEKGFYRHSEIYQLNDELQLIDSCTIRDDYCNPKQFRIVTHIFNNYLYKTNSTVFLYYPEFFPKEINPAEKSLHDTLYCFENKQLIPKMKLNIKNRKKWLEEDSFILCHIYRSSRYIFVEYSYQGANAYCYDLETGKTYNTSLTFEPQESIDRVENRVLIENKETNNRMKTIRPIANNPELLFYVYTHIKPDDLVEPNPTLYIGKLKK